MGVSVSLEGFDNILEKIKEMGARAGPAENKALHAGAEIIQKAASQKAPRSSSPRQPARGSQSWRTGKHLADNIGITRVKMDEYGGKYVEVGPGPGDNSPFFYGKFLEYGTSKMSARPFMGPAAAESKADVRAVMAETLKRGLGI